MLEDIAENYLDLASPTDIQALVVIPMIMERMEVRPYIRPKLFPLLSGVYEYLCEHEDEVRARQMQELTTRTLMTARRMKPRLSKEEENLFQMVAYMLYQLRGFLRNRDHLQAARDAAAEVDREEAQEAQVRADLQRHQDEFASQRAGKRREARKLRAANEQAQASRSAVQVSEDALRAVEEQAAAMELAAAAAAAGQGGSGRRARTPSPVRTAEEEAAAEAAAEAEKKAEAARLRNEKALAKQREQQAWLAKQQANKKGKGKGKAKVASQGASSSSRDAGLPLPPRVDLERAANEALQPRP